MTENGKGKAGLYSKLAKVMGGIDRLPKNGYNKHFKYHFVTDADVADAVRGQLAANGVAFIAEIKGMRQDGKRVLIDLTFTLACGETGATITSAWIGEALDSQDKGINKAVTSAEKYFLLKTFVMGAGDDPDEGNEPVATKQPARAAGKPPAGVWPARPFDAKHTIRALRMKRDDLAEAGMSNTEPLPDERRGALMGALAAVTAGDDERHRLGWALWGKTSTKDWTAAEAEATIAWVDIGQDEEGNWAPSPLAVEEARAVVAGWGNDSE